MPILSKNLPPPPAPELTPEQIETKRRIEAEEAEKQAVARRLDDARKRLGKLSPQLISDVRLLIDAEIDAIVAKDAGCGIPLQSLRNMLTRGSDCQCRSYLIATGELK
jgi:hypothetical protein